MSKAVFESFPLSAELVNTLKLELALAKSCSLKGKTPCAVPIEKTKLDISIVVLEWSPVESKGFLIIEVKPSACHHN